jgi:hypothetical protein
MKNYATLLIGLGLSLASLASANVEDRIYDFTDTYYRANGIDPLKLIGRKQAPSTSAVFDTPFFSFQRNVRVISTSSAYGASGNMMFFSVLAGFGPDGFTNDAAGRNARVIADKYAEYIFPSRGADPIGLGNARQSVIQDTSNGYFSNDPLGLWLHVWINFTPNAFNTKDGIKALADLRIKNGTAKDGTPIIRTTSEINDLYSKGFITKSTRNDGLRYAVCPVMKDPRDGGIAPDAFYNPLKFADGSLVEPRFATAFFNLKTSGDWDNRP